MPNKAQDLASSLGLLQGAFCPLQRRLAAVLGARQAEAPQCEGGEGMGDAREAGAAHCSWLTAAGDTILMPCLVYYAIHRTRKVCARKDQKRSVLIVPTTHMIL